MSAELFKADALMYSSQCNFSPPQRKGGNEIMQYSPVIKTCDLSQLIKLGVNDGFIKG